MVSLNEISGIGFGSYRTSLDNPEHKAALAYALSSGCNLIDTASNYLEGKSEEFVGEVINGAEDVFIITKTGYIVNSDLDRIKRMLPSDVLESSIYEIEKDFFYCIHQDYIKIQIQQSLSRLNRSYLDCFLLHNPEYLFKVLGSDAIYELIHEAFKYLESLVDQGLIRYYGLSSNTIAFSAVEDESFSISKLVEIARNIKKDNGFKFIQFPFNFYENQAYAGTHENNKSLIQLAKENDLITIGNRPLNCMSPDGFVRLAYYNEMEESIHAEGDTKRADEVISLLAKQVKIIDSNADINEIQIISYLQENWNKIGNPESVSKIFNDYVLPFSDHIYDGQIPESVMSGILALQDLCIIYSKIGIHKKAKSIFLQSEELQSLSKTKPQISACKFALDCGIDHVLVGMRSTKYVEDMKEVKRF